MTAHGYVNVLLHIDAAVAEPSHAARLCLHLFVLSLNHGTLVTKFREMITDTVLAHPTHLNNLRWEQCIVRVEDLLQFVPEIIVRFDFQVNSDYQFPISQTFAALAKHAENIPRMRRK